MSNRKLYMLKVACARLHDLKVQERRYKGALVKRACMHLLVKQAADPYENMKRYDELDELARQNLDAKVNWNSGFWGTALGKLLRPYFENGDHDAAYAQVLTQFVGSNGVVDEDGMRDVLSRMGVDPSKHRSIMDHAIRVGLGRDTYIEDLHKANKSRNKKLFDKQMAIAKERYDKLQSLGKEEGWIPNVKQESTGGYGGSGRGWHPRRSGYLTDMQTIYDPEFARAYGLDRGTNITNNYYYGVGPDGKPIKMDASTGKPADPPKPGATTPGPDPNPDLPGLSTVLGTSDPGSHYASELSSLSGMTLDPKKISMTAPGDPLSTPGLPSGLGAYSSDPVASGGSFGSTSLTTTRKPDIDLGSGGLTLDPSVLSAAILAEPPKPTATMSAIDKGSSIAHDLVDVFGGGNYVDKGTDWLKSTYSSLPDWGKEVADQAVTGAQELAKPSAPDPSKPWTYVPR